MANNSAFDPNAFLTQEVEGSNSTKLIPIDDGEYNAQVKKLTSRLLEIDGEPRIVVDVTWEILDEEVKSKTKMDHPQCRQGIFLDMLPGGSIDMGEGKNVTLGKLRDAVGMNKKGRFSFAQLTGAMAKIRTKQSVDKKDPDLINVNVIKVTKA